MCISLVATNVVCQNACFYSSTLPEDMHQVDKKRKPGALGVLSMMFVTAHVIVQTAKCCINTERDTE